MALRNYQLREPSTVIYLDGRDPYVSWQHHLDRTYGQRGGVDIVARVGTPVLARTSGTLRQIPNNGGAGMSCQFFHDDNPGWRDVFSHLSEYAVGNGAHVNAGDVVAYTGDTGGVAQHLHWHLLDPGHQRRNPWDYFTPASSTAGGNAASISTRKENLMRLAWTTDGTGWLVTDQGWTGLPSPQVYNLFWRLINSNQGNSPFGNGASPESFLRAEVDMMIAQQRLIAVGVQTSTTIDPVKLASAISDALGRTLGVAHVDPAELAAAFDVAVPRIAAAVTKAAGLKLSA